MSITNENRDWKHEFEIAPGVVFLNHATFGPVPRKGRLAVEDLLRRQGRLESDPDVDDESYALLAAAKNDFAGLIGQRPERVAFVPNASFALNALLWGLDLRAGERVLVAENEFPAIVYAVRNLALRLGLQVERLPCPDGHVAMETLKQALRQGAAALPISWVQYFNGYRYDAESLAQLCHTHRCLLILDASQGAGAIPMGMAEAGVDAVACGAQKWLLGQTGAGFFSIAENPIRPIRPLYAGWLGYDWGYRFGDLQRWDRPLYDDGRRWEVGSYPYYSLRLAAAGVALLAECGIAGVYSRTQALIERLVRGLEGTRYPVQQFDDPDHRSAIVAVSGPHCEALREHLSARRIHVALREGNIRVSPHFYNSVDDIDALVEEVRGFDR
ncbi:MAG: aminotransferase class V-fold PLP-dependent enzyme [candidate division Zixibacteria bacterium]|nr:aminotransferase class V-fold PLP-dependent enzyme [candidate division Zixibacteria bacterium]